MSRIDETIEAKKEKRLALEKQGINPHPYSFVKKQTLAQAQQLEGQTVQTAGRIIAKREHGKVVFFDLQDQTGQIQLMIRQQELATEEFEKLSLIDPGDFLGASGEVMTTRTGELSILVKAYTFLGKALRPLPSEWNVAENKEARYRQRYLDMLVNHQVKAVLDARWSIEKEIRRYLQDEHSFVEVETPILQPLYGGTNASPFTTHMDALNCDFYLRVAPELYLKRLIVGGYEKIFEIARNFRNEGIDQTHQPEFTMIEWYEAYADYHRMMDVAEGLIKHLVQAVHGSYEMEVREHKIDVEQKWPRITMLAAMKRYLEIDYSALTDQQVKALLVKHKIELIGAFTRGKAQFALFDKLVPPHLIKPIWIIDYPRAVSPLSKTHRLDPKMAERFEGYIGGKELADGWSEIADPIDQRQIFENEQQRMREGDNEAHPLDEDFLQAMEYGLPPLGGIGIGIDRLVMFMTNTWSIKEVIAFPTLKPLQHTQRIQVKEKVELKDNDNELPPRQKSQQLLEKHIDDQSLRHHCQMVATVMAAYAKKLGENEELWYQTGLLHDLDWEEYPDEHPQHAIDHWLQEYPSTLQNAILAHAPHRTGVEPTIKLAQYLYACDELSGLMNAYALMRPTNFKDMKASKVKKKLKDKSFAAGVNREDVKKGFALIEETENEHINFLIEIFSKMD